MFEKYNKLWLDCPTNIAQSLRELKVLSFLLEQTEIKNMLEIGSANGGSLWWWSKILDKANIYSIEINPSNYENLIDREHNFHLFHKSSLKTETVDEVKDEIVDLDFLFIDGDHHRESAEWDYNHYSPLMDEGIIALHDVFHPKLKPLREYWKELRDSLRKKEGYFTLEIISSYPDGKGAKSGTGIIIKGLTSEDVIPNG